MENRLFVGFFRELVEAEVELFDLVFGKADFGAEGAEFFRVGFGGVDEVGEPLNFLFEKGDFSFDLVVFFLLVVGEFRFGR